MSKWTPVLKHQLESFQSLNICFTFTINNRNRNELKRNVMEGNLSSCHEEEVSFIGPQALLLVPPPTVSADAINALARKVESERSAEIWIIRKLFICYCKRNHPSLDFTLKLLFAYCLSQKLRLDPSYEVDSKWWYFFKKIIGSEDFSRAHYCVRRWLIQRGWLARNLNLHHFVIGMHTVPNTVMTNFLLNHPTSRDPTEVSPQPPYPFSSWEVYLHFHSQYHRPASQPLPNALTSANDVSAATSTECGAKLNSNKDHDDEEEESL